MKKLTIVFALTLATLAAQAQTGNPPSYPTYPPTTTPTYQPYRTNGYRSGDFHYGIQASPTFSWIATNDKLIESSGTNIGLKFGVQAEYYFSPKMAFFTGLNFDFNRGGTIQNDYTKARFWPKTQFSRPGLDTMPANANFHYSMTHLEIPFGIKAIFGSSESSPMKFWFEIPVLTFGFVTKATGDISQVPSSTQDERIRDDVNGLAVSLGAGLGIQYEIWTDNFLLLGLVYQRQLNDLTPDDQGASVEWSPGQWRAEKSVAHISSLAIRAGLLF